jgi:hypothetical protein
MRERPHENLASVSNVQLVRLESFLPPRLQIDIAHLRQQLSRMTPLPRTSRKIAAVWSITEVKGMA